MSKTLTSELATARGDEPRGAAEGSILPGFDALFEDAGIGGWNELPVGVGELEPREARFVFRLSVHGQKERAAVEAGYSPGGAGQTASELLRKPRVLRLYRAIIRKSGMNAVAAVSRLEERSRLFHEKLVEVAQELRELEYRLEVVGGRVERSEDSAKEIRDLETRRVRQVRLEAHYARLAADTDKLLLAHAGKLVVGVEVNGSVRHEHVRTVPNEVIEFLSAGRGEVANG